MDRMFSFILTGEYEKVNVFMYINSINDQVLILGINKFIKNSNYIRKFHKSNIKLLKSKYDGNLLNFILSNHS